MRGSVIRLCLLVLLAVLVLLPAGAGGMLMLMSLVFCDTGTIEQCRNAGLSLLAWCAGFALMPLPMLVILITGTARWRFYVRIFPVLALVLAAVVLWRGESPFGFMGAAIYVVLAALAWRHAVGDGAGTHPHG